MALKIGSDTFTVVKILQNAIKRDRIYNGESGFQADWFQCLWEVPSLIPVGASSIELESPLNVTATVGWVYVTKAGSEFTQQWDVTCTSNGGDLSLHVHLPRWRRVGACISCGRICRVEEFKYLIP